MRITKRIRIFFAWYDLWVGAYWSRDDRALYICPLPTIAIRIQFGWFLDVSDVEFDEPSGEWDGLIAVYDAKAPPQPKEGEDIVIEWNETRQLDFSARRAGRV